MNRVDRAKQFLPFDAMKGLKEALLEREEKLKVVRGKKANYKKRFAILQNAFLFLKERFYH